MSMPWNLLNYPALRQRRRRRHQVITSLAGWVIGSLMAWATVHGLEGSLKRWRMQHAQFQAQWIERSQQLRQEQQRVMALERNRQEAQYLSLITRQHQAWTALNEVLRSEAAGTSWRLSRLQLESGKLELNGWSRDFDSLGDTRQKLMGNLQGHLPQPDVAGYPPLELVRQTSVTTRGGHDNERVEEAIGVEFVWVSSWPALKSLNAAARSSGIGARP